ncbi:MAG: FHA domain-containing serine/threonine-protein kinase [Bacteroidota bacterium]
MNSIFRMTDNSINGIFNENEIPERFTPAAGEEINHYRIEKILGEGTFGSVYKVTDKYTGNLYALKLLKLWEVLPEERLSLVVRFIREFKCGQIENPNLVYVSSYGKIRGNPFLVMEFCSKGDLKGFINAGLSSEQINGIAKNVLNGLLALHSNGIIHRDIKPENILLDDEGVAHLTDFGIAGFKNARMTRKNIFGHARELFGTYAYMPPEQVNPKISFNTMCPATDIFSFGVVMYETYTKQLPFGPLKSNPDLAEYVLRANKGSWDNIRTIRNDIPEIWVRIIEGCLNPDYTQRFQSVTEILPLLGMKMNFILRPQFNFDKDVLGLQVMNGDEHEKIYPLSEMLIGNSGILTLGWFDEENPGRNAIEIKEIHSSYISSFHATIEKDGNSKSWYIRDGQWRIKDGKQGWHTSTNGIYVNSKKADISGIAIFPGDIIILGDTTLKIIILNS